MSSHSPTGDPTEGGTVKPPRHYRRKKTRPKKAKLRPVQMKSEPGSREFLDTLPPGFKPPDAISNEAIAERNAKKPVHDGPRITVIRDDWTNDNLRASKFQGNPDSPRPEPMSEEEISALAQEALAGSTEAGRRLEQEHDKRSSYDERMTRSDSSIDETAGLIVEARDGSRDARRTLADRAMRQPEEFIQSDEYVTRQIGLPGPGKTVFDLVMEPYIKANPGRAYAFLCDDVSVNLPEGTGGYQPVVEKNKATGKMERVWAGGQWLGWKPKELHLQDVAAEKVKRTNALRVQTRGLKANEGGAALPEVPGVAAAYVSPALGGPTSVVRHMGDGREQAI